MPPKGRTSATPGPKPVRNTRPALNNGINSSYGSRGVADLGAQMTTGRAQETYSHFQRVTRSNSTRPEPTPVVREPTASPSSSPRPDTAILPGAGYDASLRQRSPAAPPRDALAVPVELVAERAPARGAPQSLFWRAVFFVPSYLPRFLTQAEVTFAQKAIALALSWFFIAGIFVGMLSLLARLPLPRTLSFRRAHIIRGFELATAPLEVFNLPENITGPPDQATYNKLLYYKTLDMEKETDQLKAQVGLHEESIAELRRLLPTTLAVQKDENGTYIIPEPFWKALLDKIGNDGAAPLWDSFIAGNKAKLEAMIDDRLEHDKSENAFHSISRFDFEATLAANNKMHEDDMRLQLNNFKELVMHEAKKMVDEGAATTLGRAQDMLADSVTFKISTQQISALSLTNLVYNRYQVQNEVNHFSLGMGAIVDPDYTSETALPKPLSWFASLYAQWWFSGVAPNPPANALSGWEEGTECWCARPGSDVFGQAQLTVKLEQKIRPFSVILEHIPPKGTRDIAAAPRRYQVWAQLSNKTEAARVQNELMKEYAYKSYTYPLCGKPPLNEKNWVCILTSEYDIHANNNVQTKHVHGTEWVESDKIAVRVTENWGAKDHTCLYRVRVTGEEVEGSFPDRVSSPLWANREELNLDGQALGRND